MVYEISLSQARINAGSSTINSVIDERYKSDVAGLVSSLITVPFDQFQEQWNNWFSDIQDGAPAMGGMRIYVQSEEPPNPVNKDIWIDLND